MRIDDPSRSPAHGSQRDGVTPVDNCSGDPASQQQAPFPSYAPPESGRELSAFALEFAVAPDGAARKYLVETSGETLDHFNELHGLGLDVFGVDRDDR